MPRLPGPTHRPAVPLLVSHAQLIASCLASLFPSFNDCRALGLWGYMPNRPVWPRPPAVWSDVALLPNHAMQSRVSPKHDFDKSLLHRSGLIVRNVLR